MPKPLPTVLYVEDDINDVVLMRRAFRKFGSGAQLQVVTDGQAAVDYLGGAGDYANRSDYPLPSIVLLDLHLPGRDGFEVLRWMREQLAYQHLPVIIFTSSIFDSDRVRATALGADDFWSKPNSTLQLGRVIRRLRFFWEGRDDTGTASSA
jgi:CheY-like chemotaxis protein